MLEVVAPILSGSQRVLWYLELFLIGIQEPSVLMICDSTCLNTRVELFLFLLLD